MLDNRIQVVIYEWPESQLCMECEHGEFVFSDKLFINSNYACLKNCKTNTGITCNKFKQKLETEEEIENQ